MTGVAFAIATCLVAVLAWDIARRWLRLRGTAPDDDRLRRIERELEQHRVAIKLRK